ncbi:sialidase family protein [Sphingobacterium sp. SYP-B4668]|uniref:sialidase family protein n=1 Tax=Sphingobacterium sp. SYP-B4668 TaxID=2996035 RepID=UPI0022DD9D28|nr:exo-alpha-sialidase [Sphingobacterium sp. SYP-B4668]
MKRIYIAFLCMTCYILAFGQQSRFEVVDRSFIFPFQGQHVHGSSIVELTDGNLLAAWFQGSGERTADDVKIMGAKYSSKDKKWGTPYILADTEGMPDCNPVLFLHKGKLHLVWIAVQANRWEYSILRVKNSTDFKKEQVNWTWQDNILLKPDEHFVDEVKLRFKELPATGHGWAEYAPRYDDMVIKASEDLMKRSFGWMTRIKPLLLSTGRLLLPIYSDGLNFSLMAYSDDDGEHWKSSLPVVGRGNIQPTLIENSKGEIMAYMRDTGDKPALLHTSVSKDQGLSWTASQEIDIPSTASVEAVKVRQNNWLLLVNDTEDGRHRLSLYQSKDEGKSWNSLGPIVEDKTTTGRFSYPAMILTSNGMVHLTYSHHKAGETKSIEHVIINPKSIN